MKNSNVDVKMKRKFGFVMARFYFSCSTTLKCEICFFFIVNYTGFSLSAPARYLAGSNVLFFGYDCIQ